MPRQQGAGIFHTSAAFQPGFVEITGLRNDGQPGTGDGHRTHIARIPETGWITKPARPFKFGLEPPDRHARTGKGRTGHAADKPGPGFLRADPRRNLWAANGASGKIGEDIGGPDDQQHPEHDAQPTRFPQPDQRNARQSGIEQSCREPVAWLSAGKPDDAPDNGNQNQADRGIGWQIAGGGEAGQPNRQQPDKALRPAYPVHLRPFGKHQQRCQAGQRAKPQAPGPKRGQRDDNQRYGDNDPSRQIALRRGRRRGVGHRPP